MVPTMLARLLEAGLREPPTLRWVLLGGGPIAPALLERAEAAGVPVAASYGMTEACSQIATAGWPLLGTELALGPDGEVLVRGRTVAVGALSDDGWLHTGDRGAFDAEGRLQIEGRLADTIVTGGENVSPVEVEAVLLEHPEVRDAAVLGRPDPEWGEAVVALVMLRDPTAAFPEAELRAHCAAAAGAVQGPEVLYARPVAATWGDRQAAPARTALTRRHIERCDIDQAYDRAYVRGAHDRAGCRAVGDVGPQHPRPPSSRSSRPARSAPPGWLLRR